MLTTVKTALYQLIKGLNYNISDNGAYRENFPWLMLRTSRQQVAQSFDVQYQVINLIIDIFSVYPGEKEIIDIAENITSNIQTLRLDLPEITYIEQSGLKILDDNTTGPVRKHGVLSYQFILTIGMKEVEENEATNPTEP